METGEIPLIGLGRELDCVARAMRAGEPLLLLGPAGCGKTKVLRTALPRAPASSVYVECCAAVHELLVRLARELLAIDHDAFLSVVGDAANPERWLAAQTSSHLRGLLWNALETAPALIVLDQVQGAGPRTYRFFERLFFREGMTILAAARSGHGLGMLGRLFWDPRRTVAFAPLGEPEACRLFEFAADRFALRGLELEEFRRRVIASARGNPGQILEMCRLAAQPRYHSGRRIKFAPLRIDAMMRFL